MPPEPIVRVDDLARAADDQQRILVRHDHLRFELTHSGIAAPHLRQRNRRAFEVAAALRQLFLKLIAQGKRIRHSARKADYNLSAILRTAQIVVPLSSMLIVFLLNADFSPRPCTSYHKPRPLSRDFASNLHFCDPIPQIVERTLRNHSITFLFIADFFVLLVHQQTV